MAAVASAVDSLVKEYLIFRGFTNTLKSYETEIKTDKDKSYQVENIVEHFSLCINNYDVLSLRKYWKYFDRCYFCQLGHDTYKIIKKLETNILKLYIIHAIQNNKLDKVNEFFEKYSGELHHEDIWKDWFVLPFMKNPEQTRSFSIYFTKIWQDSVLLSLGNCLETVFCNISLPLLLNFEKERKKMKLLDEENFKLKEQLATCQKDLIQLRNQMVAGKCAVATQTMDLFIDLNSELSSPRVKKKSPTIKPKFGWKGFLSKDKENAKSAKKETSKEDKSVYRNSFDENALRKLLNKTHMKSDTPILIEDGKKKSVENISSSSLDLNETNDESDKQAQFYVALEDKLDDTTVPKDTKSDNTQIHDSKHVESPETPFIVLSQDEFREHSSSIVSCKFSDNSNTVASLDLTGVLKIWQCYPSISSTSTISLKNDYVSLDWVPKLDGKLLLGKSNGQLSLFDVSNQKKTLWESTAHPKFKRVNSIACSPTSATAVCSVVSTYNEHKKSSLSQQKLIRMKQYSSHNNPSNAKEGSLSLWDLHTGQKKNDLSLDPYPVCIHSLSYNHNGTLLVTGGADGMIRLFDIHNSDCLIGWHAHSKNVLDVKFNPDETCIYSMGADGKLCVWDINKVSSKIAEFPLHSGSTGSYHYVDDISTGDEIPNSKLMACDSEGNHMMTCAPSGLMIYKVKPSTIMEEVMHVISRCSEVLTLDWTSSPNCSTAMCGTKKGTVQISTLLKR